MKQSLLAYLLLILLLFAAWKMVVKPFQNNYKSQKSITQVMQLELQEAKQRIESAQQRKKSDFEKVIGMLSSGVLIFTVKPNDADQLLQLQLKKALQNSAAKIVQLRPRLERVSGGIYKSILDVDLRLDIEDINELLRRISQNQPQLSVELLNLQSNDHLIGLANKLDLSLQLVLWHTNDEQYTNAESRQSGSTAENNETQLFKKNESLEKNMLQGLFDAQVRQRLKVPSLSYYRLAALNLSKLNKAAIVMLKDSDQRFRLKEGDTLDVWRVEAIKADGIVLNYNGTKKTLTMANDEG